MSIEQRACVDPNRGILCQAVVSGNLVFAPLHVIDYRTATLLSLMNRYGNIEDASVAEVLAVDPACDMVVFRTVAPVTSTAVANVIRLEECGDNVEIRAIFPTNKDGGTPGLTVRDSRIRDVVEIERHAYRAASGRLAIARGVRALFLTDALPVGWSGAPVILRGTSDVAGFIHGNASVNGGAAVCLVPMENSVLRQWLHK
jgi:hypothetical protein